MKLNYISGLIALAILGCKSDEEGTTPTYKELTEAVYASGNVYPQNEYRLFAEADGVLTRQLVNEGDSVGNNQLLFVLESASTDARSQAAANIYRQSEANLTQSSPVLNELETQIRTTRTRVENDSINYVRQQGLYEKNATSKAELERAELAYRTSRNELAARQQALQRTRNQLYVELQNARSQYQVTSVDANNYRLRSYGSGKVYEVYKKPGELVRRTEAVALIGSSNHAYVQMAVDESDFTKVKVGQEVLIKVDAFDQKVYKARVSKIYPKLNRVDQSFRVDAEFEGEAPEGYYGLTVEANIIISQNNRALTLPKTYVVGGDSVWIQEGSEKKKIKISKGAENLDLVEVKSGLTENTVVLKPM
ncbi:efflux RND transporter periplasmic adaptor subunit [Telluribacter sp.]|jgi:multidrug efflux pump subunit AcrA (membrane-fusion protein)|uniref:efflux RND transporter periplasmic adaptor subunit n=1 Tax=Telluribacter sp. TaxID=1978767 RepID=UPI002E11DCC4|nr:HlyD family efflux transporter periplasmic adaptor subunit [Telluribacter sp.]